MPGKRLKKVRGRPSGAKRLVPVHSELIACGLLQHHAKRLEEAGLNAILFPGNFPRTVSNKIEKRNLVAGVSDLRVDAWDAEGKP
jgi:hypothetical protein